MESAEIERYLTELASLIDQIDQSNVVFSYDHNGVVCGQATARSSFLVLAHPGQRFVSNWADNRCRLTWTRTRIPRVFSGPTSGGHGQRG